MTRDEWRRERVPLSARITPQDADAMEYRRVFLGGRWEWATKHVHGVAPTLPEWRSERVRLANEALKAGETDDAKALHLAESLLPPKPVPYKPPSKIKLGFGLLFHREETMGRIWDGIKRGVTSIAFRKAAMGFVATLFGAVSIGLQSDASFSTAALQAFQQQGVVDAAVNLLTSGNFPFPAEIVAALFGALGNLGRNKLKQASKARKLAK